MNDQYLIPLASYTKLYDFFKSSHDLVNLNYL